MAQPLKNKYSDLGLRQTLLIPAFGFCLIVGLTILPATWFYLDHLDQQQSDKLGHILVAQLADQARQPLLYEEKISLQVLVDRLLKNNEYVLQATIFDADEKLQVQSDHSDIDILYLDDLQFNVYKHRINLEQKAAGEAQIAIDATALKSASQIFFRSLILIWLMLSALLLLGLAFAASHLAQRISNLVASLPGTPKLASDNEITQLEASIKPLLIKPPISLTHVGSRTNEDAEYDNYNNQTAEPSSLILTIYCENIPRLQSQLTQQNYHLLLWHFDALANCAIRLFDGTRLPGSKDCIHIIFGTDGNQDNALLRAISCYTSIADVLRDGAQTSGSGFILRGAIRLSRTLATDCLFKQDQVRERDLQKLIATTALGESWQLLIAADLVEAMQVDGTDQDMAGDSADNRTDQENAFPKIELSYEVLQKDLVLFTALGKAHQEKLTGQLAYLHSQLSEQVGLS